MITTAQQNINWEDQNVVAQFNLLTPINVTNERDLFQKSVVSIVSISADKNNKDVYPQKGGGLSLSKTGLMKISAAAGMQTTTKIEYMDKETVVFSAKASYTDYSGQQREGTGTKEVSRKGEFALEKAESGAILRAIRGLLAIKTSYTMQELQKPFAIPHSVYAPNYADPQVKQVALQKFSQEKNLLFGGSSEPAAQIEAPKSPEVLKISEVTPNTSPEDYPDVCHDGTPAIQQAPQSTYQEPAFPPATPVQPAAPIQPVQQPVQQQAPAQNTGPLCGCGAKTVLVTGESAKGSWKAWGCENKCGAKLSFINDKQKNHW